MKRRAFWLALILLTYAMFEGFSFLTLFLLRTVRRVEYSPRSATVMLEKNKKGLAALVSGKTPYLMYSAALGWTIKPWGSSGLYRANSQGIRANREFAPVPPRHVLRISSFGDSFTHGSEVQNEDTWQEVLMNAHRGVEVLNFGVMGYGLDQAYLRYEQDGVGYNSHIALIGFLSENIYRSVNVFRPFYAPLSEQPLAKPRYILVDGKLVLVPNPVEHVAQYRDLLAHPQTVLPRLGVHDHFYRRRYDRGVLDFLPSVRVVKIGRHQIFDRRGGIETGGYYDERSEAFNVTKGIFDLFVESAARHGSSPVILVFPDRTDILRYRARGTRRYAPLLAYFRAKGYRYIDLLDAFGEQNSVPIEAYVPSHYSPLANRLVADTVWRYLRQEELAKPVQPLGHR